MNRTLGQQLLPSVREYFNYRILKDGAAFTNQTVNLYGYTDEKFPNRAVYGSSYAQWAYHGEINGVVIPSGVSSPSFINRGTDGLALDFRNGRALFSGTQTGLTLTATVSVNDINTYVTTYSTSKLLHETKFLESPVLKSPTGYLPPYSNVTSAVFFRSFYTENTPMAIGGQEWSLYKIRGVALMDNNTHLSVISDIFRDSSNRIFPILGTGQLPLNEFNDLKAGWNYADILANPLNYAFIDKVSVGFLENDAFTVKNPDLEVSIINLDIRIPRFPRQELP